MFSAFRMMGIGALGAGLMYLFDPNQGRRRRIILRDKSARALRSARNTMDVAVEDLKNRAHGILAAGKSRIEHAPIPDDILVQRIRTKLGRYVSHPKAIEVKVLDGCACLSGAILQNEMKPLLRAVWHTPGISGLGNNLEVHSPGADPLMRGGNPRHGEHMDVLQARWSPATRFLAAVAGMSCCALGVRRSGVTGFAMTSTGVLLIAEAATNFSIRAQESRANRKSSNKAQPHKNAAPPPEDSRMPQQQMANATAAI